MDLEHARYWLSLAQQPYPLISEFLKQITTIKIETEISLLIPNWLQKHRCKINNIQLNKDLLWLQQPGHQLLSLPQYPEHLKTIKDPPAILFLAGNSQLLFSPGLAIVGSRKPSNGGRENAIYFAKRLAEAGLTLISGLATGIDGLVHQSALQVNGLTAAVLGCGHNTCYPEKHNSLFQQIKQSGLLISEFSPDTGVKPYQFPRRNRIISGLSLGVLVVEAAIKSGSLITCRLAAEQGREVFAIPGDISNPMTRGCHHLIREGACLVDNPQQILEELGFDIKPSNHQKKHILGLSVDENNLLNCIDRHPTNIDNIVNRSGMKLPLVLSVLFSLELKSRVTGSADGYFKKQME